MRPAATGRRRPPPTRADYDALRRGLAAAGIDEDYFGHDDVMAMWSWGYSVERIVAVAKLRGERTSRSA